MEFYESILKAYSDNFVAKQRSKEEMPIDDFDGTDTERAESAAAYLLSDYHNATAYVEYDDGVFYYYLESLAGV